MIGDTRDRRAHGVSTVFRTSRSDDGCAALTGGTAASRRLNSRRPADAVRDGTKRSEYTVSFFPLEPGVFPGGDSIARVERVHPPPEWEDAGRGDAAFHGTGRFRDHRDTQPFVDSSNPHVRLDTTRTHPRLPTSPETQTSRLEIIDATAAADDARRVVCPPAVSPPFLSNIQF